MSVWDREYVARFAPATALTREALEQPDRFHESWSPWAFHSMRDEPIPVRLSHDKSDHGKVGWLGTRYTDDGWHYATFKLDSSLPQAAVALERIKVGCPVSMGHCDTGRDQWAEDANAGVSRTTHSYLTELSILDPTHERPGIEGAQITRIREPAKPVNLDDLNARLKRLGITANLKPIPPMPTTTRAEPAGHVIHHPAASAIRRTRSLDEELVDWWKAAPDGLDDETWEQVLEVLQRRHHGPSIHDLYRRHLAAVR